MPTIHTLFLTSLLRVLDASCPAGPKPDGVVEMEPSFVAVLPRTGVYVQQVAGRRVVVDPTVGILLEAGSEHRTSHPSADGDASTVISMPDEVVDLIPRAQHRADPIPQRISTRAFLRHREMLTAIRRSATTALEVDEWALATIGHLASRDGAMERPASGAHRTLVGDAREYLAVHYRDDAGLRDIARGVGSSPYHLSRIFGSVMGCTLSAHRTELRLRHVVDQLARGHSDLARLAVATGFCDHAHLTKTVRRHLGITPSLLRERLRVRSG